MSAYLKLPTFKTKSKCEIQYPNKSFPNLKFYVAMNESFNAQITNASSALDLHALCHASVPSSTMPVHR